MSLVRLCRAGSAVGVVFLTMHNKPELVEAAQAAGGIGYVLRARLSSDLTIAIAEALENRRYVSRLRSDGLLRGGELGFPLFSPDRDRVQKPSSATCAAALAAVALSTIAASIIRMAHSG